MELRKTVKKMVALGTGVAMVGATLFGAAAADLGDYPSPLFIQDGQFNAFIVVGAAAASEDVVGAIEMASSLQTASVKKTTVSGTTTVSFDEGVQIDESGDRLRFGKYIQDVQDTPLDDTDFDLLADGVYDDTEGNTDNDVTYTQELEFFASNGQILFDQDDSDAPLGADYLYFAKSAAYVYELEFDDSVDYDNATSTTSQDDLETTELQILGNTFTITDVDVQGNGRLVDKVTMLAGETVQWIAQGEPITKSVNGVAHTIELQDVNEGEDQCGLLIDGQLEWVDDGQTKTISGISIGVSDVIATHKEAGADACQVNVGATKLVLEDGQELEIDGVDVDGAEVQIQSTTGGKWDGFNVTYTPDDEIYLAAGDSHVDAIFGLFKISYEGLSGEVTETISADSSGEDATLTFLNSDGEEVRVDWFYNTTNGVFILGDGNDIDDRIHLEGEFCDGGTNVTNCEGVRFWAVTTGGEGHMMEINDFDHSNQEIEIKDVTYDGATKQSDFDMDAQTDQTVSLPSGAGSVTLTLSNGSAANTATRINFTDIDKSTSGFADTLYNEDFGINLSSEGFSLKEETDDDVSSSVLDMNMTYDATDSEINWQVMNARGFHATSKDFDEDNDDDQWYVSNWSTMVLYDNDDKLSAEIEYPDEYRYGQVFVASLGASASSSGGAVETVELVPIQVGTAKLDTEIASVQAQNLIVVGGPCANSVAASLMGNPADCAEGFTPGEAMINLYEHSNGNVALLVAGYSAMDTRRATRVMANYGDYSLSGESATVTGTTLTDISVESA